GIVGILASLAYAAGGIRYVRMGLADPLFLLMFGVVAVVGTYYIQAAPAAGHVWSRWVVTEALPLKAFLAGLPVGALVTNVMVIDDIRDRAFDRIKGWRTTAVRFGLAGSRIEYLLLTVFAYLAPFALRLWFDVSAWVLLPLLTLPLAIHIARHVMTRDTTADLLAMTPRASLLAMVYAALLGTGLAL
ncbi:MAG TPA: UbiA family prenyltransferase, partial [Gammaproteobacteria bacterium]